MRAVLGIDAAWSDRNASGVALAVETAVGWRLAAVESSFERFCLNAEGYPLQGCRPRGSVLQARRLVAAAKSVCGAAPTLIAVDMPLSLAPITGPRASDRCVTSKYARRKAGAYSPKPDWPGKTSEHLEAEFRSEGFLLMTRNASHFGLAEVYPHPALVELLNAPERLKYKVGKRADYWPSWTSQCRKDELLKVWTSILAELDKHLAGTRQALTLPAREATFSTMKAFEDTLDAIICCWVGICILEGRAIAHGDDASAIWIPDGARISR